MPDVLDKYRRAAAESRKIDIQTVEGQPYKAFEAAPTPQRRLDLRPAYDAQRILSYVYLVDIVHAGGVMVGLSFSTPQAWVSITGENLEELVALLREERITAIQQHVPDWHQKPEADQPYIESLLITEPGKRTRNTPPPKH